MIRVKVELWMWLGKELGGDFQSPSEMCSILETNVEEETLVKMFFYDLASRYPAIGEKVFNRETMRFYSNVFVVFNDQVIGLNELHEKVLQEGDKMRVVPMYVGG